MMEPPWPTQGYPSYLVQSTRKSLPGYLDCLGMSFREDRRLLWLFPTGGRPAVLSWFAMLLGYSVTLAVALAMYLGIARMAKGTHGLKAK